MGERDETQKYLPLTETTTYILLALIQPLHGYGVMQKVKEISGGVVENRSRYTLWGVLDAPEWSFGIW